MASKKVTLYELKVTELKRQLEERDIEATGRKTALQEKLKELLVEEGNDPDTFLFEVSADINSSLAKLMENSANLEHKLMENSANLEHKLMENSANLEHKLMENSANLEQNLKKDLLESSNNLEHKIMEKLVENSEGVDKRFQGIEEEIQGLEKKIKEMERRISNQSLKNVDDAVMPEHSGDDSELENVSRCVNSDNVSVLSQVQNCNVNKLRVKPPEFDGKIPWPNYILQFEAASKANGWSENEKTVALTLALRGDATDVLQTLSVSEQGNYQEIVKRLEMRYGQAHLEQVYHSQLKNRCQKASETLQEFEADIAKLVRLAYPGTPEKVLERLAVQAFVDGLRDYEIRQAIILARPNKLVDALSRALEIEAAKYSARGQARVRAIDGEQEEGVSSAINEEQMRRIINDALANRKRVRCWNCGKIGHIQSKCRDKKENTPSEN